MQGAEEAHGLSSEVFSQVDGADVEDPVGGRGCHDRHVLLTRKVGFAPVKEPAMGDPSLRVRHGGRQTSVHEGVAPDLNRRRCRVRRRAHRSLEGTQPFGLLATFGPWREVERQPVGEGERVHE